DELLAARYDFSLAASAVPLAGVGVRAVDAALTAFHGARRVTRRGVLAWRQTWTTAVARFLEGFVGGNRAAGRQLVEAATAAASMRASFPARLKLRRSRIPAAFRTQDLTHHDVVALARKLAFAYPDRRQPIAVVGLRTAGSYFAPLVCAWLARA